MTPEQEQRLRGYAAGDDRWGWQNVKPSDVATLLAALTAAEAERAQAQEIMESWYRQYQATSEAWAAAEQRATRLATLEQQLRDWQDHLRRVHHTLCDFPFRTELPDDYKEEEPCVQS